MKSLHTHVTVAVLRPHLSKIMVKCFDLRFLPLFHFQNNLKVSFFKHPPYSTTINGKAENYADKNSVHCYKF